MAQGIPPGLTPALEVHNFSTLLPRELLHLPAASTEPAARAQLPAALRLAAVPALRHTDLLLAANPGPSPNDTDTDSLQETNGSGGASWVALDALAGLCGVVLIPAVSCLLAARSPFFQALFSGRWLSASGVHHADFADVSVVANSQTSPQPDSHSLVRLPIVKLASDAEAVLQLLRWMATGKMEHCPPESAADSPANLCPRCRQLQTAVSAASLAGEWLMDSAQEAAEDLVMRTPMLGTCCRMSVMEAAYAAHLEGLAHRLAKMFWAEAEAARCAEA